MKNLLIALFFLPIIIVAQSTGTGFAINSNGYIATNFHVIKGSDKVTIRGIHGNHQKSYKATVVKVDKMNDLAILKVNEELGKIPYGFKKSKEDVASAIYAYGYPLPELQGYEIKITEGIINSNSGLKDEPRWYQHTASIQSGNSGGPLFNRYGNLVGINNAGIDNDYVKEIYGTETTNVNYAIKSRYLLALMEDLELLPLVNSGINKLELSQQYKKIKNFVYFITASSDKNNLTNSNVYTQNTFKWYTDINEASQFSKKINKPLMLYFTGSDWCLWCKKLVTQVFKTSLFREWAKKNVVLVEIDLPNRKELSQKLIDQNQNLVNLFGVKGYPTIWFVEVESKSGKFIFNQIGRTGYIEGGPSSWIKKAQAILNTKYD